jgi:hypothetical protein
MEARGMRLVASAPQLLVNFSANLSGMYTVDNVQVAIDAAVAAAFAKYPVPGPTKAK